MTTERRCYHCDKPTTNDLVCDACKPEADTERVAVVTEHGPDEVSVLVDSTYGHADPNDPNRFKGARPVFANGSSIEFGPDDGEEFVGLGYGELLAGIDAAAKLNFDQHVTASLDTGKGGLHPGSESPTCDLNIGAEVALGAMLETAMAADMKAREAFDAKQERLHRMFMGDWDVRLRAYEAMKQQLDSEVLASTKPAKQALTVADAKAEPRRIAILEVSNDGMTWTALQSEEAGGKRAALLRPPTVDGVEIYAFARVRIDDAPSGTVQSHCDNPGCCCREYKLEA